MAYRINYTQVIRQANSMEELANDLGKSISSLEQLLGLVKKEWVGPASSVFQTKLITLIEEMQGSRSEMISVSSTIKTVAKRIHDADVRAARAAKKLPE